MELSTVVVNSPTNASYPIQNAISCNQTSNCTDTKPIIVQNLVELTGEVLIAILVIIGNGLVLIAIASSHSLQTVTNFYVASLAAADLLVGLLGIPCVIVAFNGLPTNFAGCLIVNSLIIVLTQISIFGLLVVALERFFAIRYPYYYYEYCTPKTTVITIVITWTAGIFVGMVPIFGWNKGKMDVYEPGSKCTFTGVIDLEYMVYMNFFGFVLPPLISMFSIYGYIYAVVRKQIRKISTLQMASSSAAAAAAAAAAKSNGSSQPLKTVSKAVQDSSHTNISTDTQMDELGVHARTKHENGLKMNGSNSNDVIIMTSSNRNETNDDSSKRDSEETESENIKEIKEKQPNAAAADVSGHQSSKCDETKLCPDDSPTKQNEIQRRRQLETRSPGKRSSSSYSNNQTMSRKSASSWKREIRAAKWFAVVLTVFTACWLPLHVMNAVTVFGGPTCAACVTFAVLLSHLNSAINPILYAYSNSKFSAVFRRMLKLRALPTNSRNNSTTLPATATQQGRATFR